MVNNSIELQLLSGLPGQEGIPRVSGAAEIAAGYPGYLKDESRLQGGSASTIFYPGNEKEVSAILLFARKQGVPVTISAGRTGITGGAVPTGGAVLSLEKLNRIVGLGVDRVQQRPYLRVQPHARLEEIEDFLRAGELDGARELDRDAGRFLGPGAPGLVYPPDPTETTATLGGTVATNASGARSFKYGATRNWIRRLRTVLPGGDILDLKRDVYVSDQQGRFILHGSLGEVIIQLPGYTMPQVKNAAGLYCKPGMDLIDLLIGSEGILGVFTEIDIWLMESKPTVSVLQFFPGETSALDFVALLKQEAVLDVEFLEYLDVHGLELLRKQKQDSPLSWDFPALPEEAGCALFFDVPADEKLEAGVEYLEGLCQRCGTALEQSLSAEDFKGREKLKALRHAVPELVNRVIAQRQKTVPEIHKLATDLSVPQGCLPEMMDFYHEKLDGSGLEYVIFGHIGDNHVHVNMLPLSLEELDKGKAISWQFAQKACQLGGSVSAEHGIGKLKRAFLTMMVGEQGVAEIRGVKRALDPKGILNRDTMVEWVEQ